MFRNGMIHFISAAVLWAAAGQGQAETFSLGPTQDGHVCNDTQYGPGQAYNTNGIHIRNISSRRRVGYVMYDLSALKAGGRVFANVKFSVLGYDPGNVVVYGVKEGLDSGFASLQFNALTWNSVPAGVPNNPAPAVDSPVKVKTEDLVGPLVSFRAPARGTRLTTDPDQSFADFLNSDADGIIVLVLAPAGEGDAGIIRSMEYADGAARLEGEIGGQPTAARDASPVDKKTDVPRDAVLSWTAAPRAASHDVYLGTSLADVNSADRSKPLGVLVSQGQTTSTYDATGLLPFDQTYYWRIDEVNAAPDSTVFKGAVWSFTTEPFSYRVVPGKATASSSHQSAMGPEKTIDGSGLNANDQHSTLGTDMWLTSVGGPSPAWIQYEFDRTYKFHQMWVWNSNQSIESAVGFGAKDVVVEVSSDGEAWTAIAGVPEFTQANGTADYVHGVTVDLGGALAKPIRLTIKSNWGGLPQTGLSEVRFFQIPVRAFEPQPAAAATDVSPYAVLKWRPGREAVRHNVYLSGDAVAVAQATALVKTTSEHSFDLASLNLEYGRTYSWRVDEVNDAAAVKTWEGNVWSFTTIAYAVIDDFEAYDDTCNRIFFSWIDGFGHNGSADCSVAPSAGNATQSTVGNISAPFAERTLINSGTQSMPMAYDNAKSPFYAETERQWKTGQAWNKGGVNTLTINFRGDAPAFLETSPGSLVMTGMGTDIFGTSDQGRFAYKTLTGDGSIVAKVESLANTNAWAKAGVMIREALTEGSSWAYIVYGGTNGVHYQARLSTGAGATSDTSLSNLPADQGAARAPVWVKVERKGNQFNGYYATDAAGTAWKPMAWNPQTITMANSVFVGLAVTSHVANTVCGARFSSVSTTGSVTGGWQTFDMGVAQPTGGNSPETFYVALQDASGKLKVVVNPDPVAIMAGAWQQWDIPLSQFSSAGVNLSSIQKMIIGVGNRTSPKSGSAGKLYIDDVRLTRLATP